MEINWKAIGIYSIILVFIITFGLGSLIQLQKHQIKQQNTELDIYKTEKESIFHDYHFEPPEEYFEHLYYNQTVLHIGLLGQDVYSTDWVNWEARTGFGTTCIINQNYCELRTTNYSCYEDCREKHKNWYNLNICNCTTEYTFKTTQIEQRTY